MKIMTFEISGETYAVEVATVGAVLRGGSAPSGSAAGGGPPLPLLDLTHRLGLGAGEGSAAPLLVLRGRGGEAVVRVERLGEVMEVDEAALLEVPRYFASPLLRGVAAIEGRLVVLLDSDALVKEAAAAAPEGSSAAERDS
jgi:chemotaxis signal transduction protein